MVNWNLITKTNYYDILIPVIRKIDIFTQNNDLKIKQEIQTILQKNIFRLIQIVYIVSCSVLTLNLNFFYVWINIHYFWRNLNYTRLSLYFLTIWNILLKSCLSRNQTVYLEVTHLHQSRLQDHLLDQNLQFLPCPQNRKNNPLPDPPLLKTDPPLVLANSWESSTVTLLQVCV